MRKGQMSLRIGLDERGEDLRMLPKVRQESITAPSSHDLHGFHGKAQEEVEKGGTNTNTVNLEGFQACQPSGRSEALDEGRLGEGAELAFVPVSKQMGVRGGAVDVEVVLEGRVWVSGTRVGAPVDVLSLQLGCLGAWNVQNGDLETIWVAINAQVGWCDMAGRGESIYAGYDELSQASS